MSKYSRRIAHVKISFPVLHEMLLLPEDARIVRVIIPGEDYGTPTLDVLHLLVEHPDFPKVEPEEQILPVTYSIRRDVLLGNQFDGWRGLPKKVTDNG